MSTAIQYFSTSRRKGTRKPGNLFPLLGALVVMMLLCCGKSLTAQTGQMTGVVTDGTGAAIPNATVQITDQKTGSLVREAKSGPDGTFRALNMPPAVYSIRVTAAGMEGFVRNNITLDEEQTLSVGNLELKVGSTTETVTVTEGEAPLIETANSNNSAIVDQRQVTEQPLNGRDFESLLTTLPGIVTNNTSQFRLVFNQTNDFFVNGMRGTANNFLSGWSDQYRCGGE